MINFLLILSRLRHLGWVHRDLRGLVGLLRSSVIKYVEKTAYVAVSQEFCDFFIIIFGSFNWFFFNFKVFVLDSVIRVFAVLVVRSNGTHRLRNLLLSGIGLPVWHFSLGILETFAVSWLELKT